MGHAKKPYVFDVIMDLVNIFQSIDYISIDHHKELASSLVVVIKYHFKDDINIIRGLITMIVESIDQEVFNELPNLVDDKLELIKQRKEISHWKSESFAKDAEIEKLKQRSRKYEEVD